MGQSGVDRQAWADAVEELIAAETGGNKSRFATLVGVNYKTVLRWLKGEVEVSEESVRQVARALGANPLELLVRVGLYDPAHVAPPAPIDKDDPALQAILEANVPPRVKARMVQRLQEIRQAERERQVDEVRWWIDQAEGA